MAYLVRLRRLQFQASRASDKAMWTAADYSVMITGLIKHGVAHEDEDSEGVISVETKLWADLARLGFKRESIDHIELGVDCAREIQIGLKVHPLTTDRQQPHIRAKSSPLSIAPTPLHPSSLGRARSSGLRYARKNCMRGIKHALHGENRPKKKKRKLVRSMSS